MRERAKLSCFCAINAKEILVTFSGTVAKASAETTANYAFSAANSSAAALTVSTAVLQDDKKSVLLTLGTTLNNKAAASYLVNIKNVTDLEGKKTVEYSELKNFADTLAPSVTGITYPDSNTIKVAFNEPINTISTGIASATTIKLDGTAVVVPSSAYTLATDKKSFTINIATSGLVNSKNYEITIDGLADFATNAMTKFVGNITFAADTTNPKVVSLTAIDLGHLKVVFDEPMKQVSSAYFKVKVGTSSYEAGTIAHFNTTTPDYKTFVFTMTTPLTVAANKVVTVDTFQDVAGNPANALTSTYTQEVAFAATKPAMTSTIGTVKTINGNAYIVFSFDRDVLYNTGNVTGTFLKDGVTYPANFNGSANIKDATTLAGLEKNEIALVAPTTAGDYKVTFPAGLAKDTYLNLMAKTDATFTFSATATSATVKTSPAPVQGNSTSTIDYVTVEFSKDVGNDALTPSNYTVDGVQVFDSAIFDGTKAKVRLTLKADSIKTTASKTFAVTGISNVTDATFDGLGTNPAKIAFTENVKPVVSKVELVALDKVRVTFSEAVTSVNAADFVVKVNGTEVTPSVVATNGAIVTLTLATPLTSSSVPVTVEIAAASDITDLTNLNLTPVGQLKTATVALSDTKGQADVALQAAFQQFVSANAGAIDGTLAAGKTATTARAAYNAAVTAVNNHGNTAETVSINSATPTYAVSLAWLKAAVLMAEAEDFAATADLTITANYDTLFTGTSSMEALTNTAVSDMANDPAVGTNDSAKVDIGNRATLLFTTEQNLLDTARTQYLLYTGTGSTVTAIDTAVTTNTAGNLATAAAAAKTAKDANTALTALTQATKTKMTADLKTQTDKVTSTVANIALAGTPNNPVVATWGSTPTLLSVTSANLALTITPTTAATGRTISIGATGTVAIDGNPASATSITVSGTHAVFTNATVVTNATGSISTGSVITIN